MPCCFMEEGRGEKGSGTLLSVLPADGEVGVAGDSRLQGRHLQCIIMAGNIYWCRYRKAVAIGTGIVRCDNILVDLHRRKTPQFWKRT